MTIQLITEWSSNDPKLTEMLRGIAALPEYSIERMEAEAALHGWQAAFLQKRIGAAEIHQRESERNRRSALQRGRKDPS